MKAVGYTVSRPVTDPQSLVDITLDRPAPTGTDVLVEVRAISVNPLDAVQRMRRERPDGPPVILGWDAAGVVAEIGPDVTRFAVGDEVYLSGDMRRDGANAEYVLADELVVAAKPRTLDFTRAASVPMTAITAYEALFDRLRVPRLPSRTQDAILLIGAAGGVGSMAVQLLQACTELHIIATASRPESRDWLTGLGVGTVLDHGHPLPEQLHAAGIEGVRYVFPLNGTADHWPAITECMAHEGEVVVVDNPQGIDATALRAKAGALHFEMMWTKVIQGNGRQAEIGRLLSDVADLIDAGRIRPAATTEMGPITAENLRLAHAAIETGRTVGKITLTGFSQS
ncbi:MAG: zinc-binding alcohol dehydrogenase family protein [Pseudooceanicola nanhaiensis]|uniref:zinc-binding alcohol dehydrogenase family protein n=1 Tax=Rhodobacterales TaxID=204455 RepID=UPI004059D181